MPRSLPTRLLGVLIARIVASIVLHVPTDTAAAIDAASSPALVCDASRDERPRLSALLASGGALAGGTLELPAGCKVLLSSPGAGGAALRLAARTRIACANGNAGFVLARRSCLGGNLPGAACDPINGDRDCPGGGRCTSDVDSGSFAPDADATYTVIGSEDGALGPSVSGCGIWVNGVSGDSTALGGSGRRYGFCAAGEHAGFSCSQQCSADSGTFAGFACTSDADCQREGAGRCLGVAQCGASCGAPALATSWGPSGPGSIAPIDLAGSIAARVDDVTIYDHRKGPFAIRVGNGGQRVAQRDGEQLNATTLGFSAVVRSTTDASTCSVTPIGVLSAAVYAPRPFVARGIVGGAFGSTISDNHVAGMAVGIHAFAGTTVRGNFVGAPTSLRDGARPVDTTSGDGLPSGIGILIGGDQTIISGNQVGGYVGLMLDPKSGFNVTVTDNRFVGGNGSKIVIPAGSGARIAGNYLAWGSSDNLECTDAGQPWPCCEGAGRGRCTGPGVLRIGFGDPAGSSGSVNHLDVIGNFLHSDQRHATYLRFDAVGSRCQKGDRAFAACSSDGDCPDIVSCRAAGKPVACCDGARSGSCTAPCRPTVHSNLLIADNDFYRGGADQTALDLSSLAANATTAQGMTFTSNRVTGFSRGVVLPDDADGARQLSFTANDYSSTASAAACTGTGTPMPCCTGKASGACAVYDGWQWSMGARSADVGLTPSDEQPTTVVLRPSRDVTFSAGSVVAIAADGGVDVARRSVDATGIALTAVTRDTDAVTVAVSGVTTCKVAGDTAVGTALAVGASPGELETSRDGITIARALTSPDAAHRVRCLLTTR